MPRIAYDVAKARRLLGPWCEECAAKAPDDAPITRDSAAAYLTARGLKTHPATLSKYKITTVLSDARRKQEAGPRARRRDAEMEAYHAQLDELRQQHAVLDRRNRELLGEIATMIYNARGLGIRDEQLTRAMPPTDRSRSRAGTGSGASKAR